jgi:amidohydrolase
MAINIRNEVLALKDEMVKMRRDLHQYPEPGFKEERTSQLVANHLETSGIEVRTGIGKTGVVGLFTGQREGKTLLLRSDMDALPIQEQNEVEYRSRNDGVMHACGHDGHMTILLTTAKILSRYQKSIKGNIRFVFQPAEEGPGGARLMIEEGVMSNPSVDGVLGLHLWNYLPIGKVGVRSGPLMASMDNFAIKIKGKSSHGAIPQDGFDAIVMSGHVITAMQAIVSREISPLQSAVISLGKIKGGYGVNIIPDQVEMEGTARALDTDLQKTIPESIERILKGVTSSMRGDYELNYQFLYPVTVNDERMTMLVEEASSSIVGSENVVVAEQTMGSEDMAFYLEKAPGCFFFVGSANKERKLDFPHHHPRFDFDEDAMLIGVEVLCAAALKFLG